MSSTGPVNVLVLVTGSVAAIKVALLLDLLRRPATGEAASVLTLNIKVASTARAMHFLQRAEPVPVASSLRNDAREDCSEKAPPSAMMPASSSAERGRSLNLSEILTDENEWGMWSKVSDEVLHIELRRWADILLVAPLDANTLAKAANGMCDNLVTCVMRAWEVGEKPVLLCPAMNTAMWEHPVTCLHLNVLRGWYGEPRIRADTTAEGGLFGAVERDPVPDADAEEWRQALFQVVGPVSKRLACGDVGVGGMAAVSDITDAVRRTALALHRRRVRHQRRAAPLAP